MIAWPIDKVQEATNRMKLTRSFSKAAHNTSSHEGSDKYGAKNGELAKALFRLRTRRAHTSSAAPGIKPYGKRLVFHDAPTKFCRSIHQCG